ncbi:TIGR03750 family conjugal transfer protein [Salmonella enterica subsp. enterica serovar Infantis]|nr:TIGR03750 family conjugal transfer protein [Salmonella enterica]EBX1769736.1 TIGR03750 family conjugal transfer protein [Salmonella enterica subsp. enterica serovar Poona]EHA1740848.1 TIGR03750 family conjugal transfer protein [Salmonella enterica subsp. enterica serovar Javiana]EHC4524934.1 TIGR03750 family conjugal transfer protein [Salmonella enterica subsp. enterica serovar Infantis]EHE0998118.1 TIGR03750 family conjugal transfer protein [Salmonella enterica subsp. enterica serovar 4,[5]
MAAIDFIPDRLNVRPVVWRGFTVGELGVATLCGAGLGLVTAVFMAPFAGWIAFPMLVILMPLPVAWFSGEWLMRYKRNKPDNYLWQHVILLLARVTGSTEGNCRYGGYRFFTDCPCREIRRTRRCR